MKIAIYGAPAAIAEESSFISRCIDWCAQVGDRSCEIQLNSPRRAGWLEALIEIDEGGIVRIVRVIQRRPGADIEVSE